MEVNFGKLFSAASSKRRPDDAPPGGRKKASARKGEPSGAALGKTKAEKNKRKKQRKRGLGGGGGSSSGSGAAPARPVAGSGGSRADKGQRLAEQLAGGQFRVINEQLYTRPSAEAARLFSREPELYALYHEGFRRQSARWPANPVQTIAHWLRGKPKSWAVGDLGCGDAELAASVPQSVRSFDLVAANSRVIPCDIASVPLPSGSLDAVVFCLALMGVNYADFLVEAHRLLKPHGALKIAEVDGRHFFVVSTTKLESESRALCRSPRGLKISTSGSVCCAPLASTWLSATRPTRTLCSSSS